MGRHRYNWIRTQVRLQELKLGNGEPINIGGWNE